MNDSWTLKVIETGQPASEVVAHDGLVIGRHPECGLVLKDSHVSSRHAKIMSTGSALAILDLGSNNGTRVDNTQVLRVGQNQPLRHGMHITIGQVELIVQGQSGASDTTCSDSLGADVTLPGSVMDAEQTVASIDAAKTAPASPQEATPAPASKAPRELKAPPVVEAPPSVSPPVPAVPGGRSSIDAFDSMALNTIVGEAGDTIGALAKLVRMGARLVLLNEADLRVVKLNALEFTVGRDSSADCELENRGVSTRHARIVFSAAHGLFLLEDLGSANGTQLNGAPLASNAPRELHADAHVRFGTIEAVFLQDLDAELRELPSARQETAAMLLVARGVINSGVLKQAKREAVASDKSLAEVLLLGQHVGGREWCRAVADAHLASTVQDLTPTRSGRFLPWLLAGLAIAAAALLATSAGREVLGLGS